MTKPLDIVFFGLSLSSSWGNGHATTFRALIRGLNKAGHRVLFLERDTPWYASRRDLPAPDFCDLVYYDDPLAITQKYASRLREADAVIIGSYVPDGVAVVDAVNALGPKRFCFYDIDTPVTMAKLDRHEEDYLAARQICLFDIYFSFTGGETLKRLERHYGARKAAALYCSVDAERYQSSAQPIRWDLGYLGTYSPDRQPKLEELLIEPARQLPHMHFVVAGPQYPETIIWPDNVERIDHLPPEDHPEFYSRQRFTLNATRADMVAAGWSPSVRLFEAAACGTPIISDYWRGLSELLPEDEAVIIAQGTAGVVKALTGIDETKRMAISTAAKSRIVNHHTGETRAAELEAYLDGISPRRSETARRANLTQTRENDYADTKSTY
ncbi:glycosyltransferase [Agrobacterium tumefaciens]|uniref:CgeB family protein n=1 Tax=Agrobacterium tumefaciens TaxID=358 RepID=UPI00384C0911